MHLGEVRTVTELLAAAKSCRERLGDVAWPKSGVWFRGQRGPRPNEAAEDVGDGYSTLALRPSAYRADAPGNGDGWEDALVIFFQHGAVARQQSSPPLEDWAQWTCLMRHHGVPTRLLDWSESVLVAAFFAAEEEPFEGEADAVIWAINSRQLNASQGLNGWLNLAHEKTARLLPPALRGDRESREEVLAAGAPQYDLRMFLQQSVFTIHGQRTPIELLPQRDTFLAFMTVPRDSRGDLLGELDQLGIRRSTLFPDLDSLAGDLRRMAPGRDQ